MELSSDLTQLAQDTALLPSFPTSAAAGIIRMSPVRYVVLSAIGFTIRMMIMLLFVGWGMETLAE